jgi:ATP-dependent RNA helicase DHX37/DHR1
LKDYQIKQDKILAEINLLESQMEKKVPKEFIIKSKALPIYQKEYEILESIHQNLITVISGETGSGKSTQVPQMLLESQYDLKGKICITQPRRLAAKSLCFRVREEVGQNRAGQIGYQVRFDKEVKEEQNKVVFMTDGILLNEMMSDFLLPKYSVIVIDEAHERKLGTDILISLLVKVVRIRAQKALLDFTDADQIEQIQIRPL